MTGGSGAIMRVLTQNLRLSAVQIRRHGESNPVGTGFFVSKSGIVATCRHVIASAGVVPETGQCAPNWIHLALGRATERGVVDIYIPTIREWRFSREGCLVHAAVKCCPREPFKDDVALLELAPPFTEISDEEVLLLGEAFES